MDQLLLIVIIILIVFILALAGIVGFFAYKILKLQKEGLESSSQNSFSPEVLEAIENAKNSKQSLTSQFCVDHPELLAKGICSISGEAFCELCLAKENETRIGRKYLDLFLDHDWDEVYILNNELTGADKLNEFYRIKKELWSQDHLPIISQKQFKINLENDQIEAFTSIKVRGQDLKTILPKINFLDS